MTVWRRLGWLGSLLAFGALSACEGAEKVPIPLPAAAEEENAASDAPVRSTSPASEETALPAPFAAPVPPEKPRFAIAPSTSRRTLAHVLEPKTRVGAYLGLPDGWRNDDPSYLLFFPAGKAPAPARAVAMTLVEPGLAEVNRARLLRRGPKPTGLEKPIWSSWENTQVGRGAYPAVVATGEGESLRRAEGPRRAVAVVVDIPGTPALGFIGSWAADHASLEDAVTDMLRAVERCQIEVGRGCVTASERKRAAL